MNIQKNITFLVQTFKHYISIRRYSVKAKNLEIKAIGKSQSEVKLEVEEDCHKLATEVCGTNLYIEGGNNVKIKPDSEYPDWLWKAHFGAPLTLEQLDPSTKEYWYKVRSIRLREEAAMLKYQKHKTVQK